MFLAAAPVLPSCSLNSTDAAAHSNAESGHFRSPQHDKPTLNARPTDGAARLSLLGSSTVTLTRDVPDEVSAAEGLYFPLQFTGLCLNEVLVTGLRYM